MTAQYSPIGEAGRLNSWPEFRHNGEQAVTLDELLALKGEPGIWVYRQDEQGRPLAARVVMFLRRLFSWRGWNLDVHLIVAADAPGCFHDHPAVAFRLILWGGYREELQDGRVRTWFPGRFGIIRPAFAHRIAGPRRGPSWSLWLRGPKSSKISTWGC